MISKHSHPWDFLKKRPECLMMPCHKAEMKKTQQNHSSRRKIEPVAADLQLHS
ncbi:MAG: hypothetical protein ACREFR_11070 [Limisphaerales bacterium]